jgi:lipoprotein-anchoring transpeptidase ErfK/SrfK
VLAVLRAGPDAAGALWVKVRLPVLPNGRVGWVRRQALGAYQTVKTRLIVVRRELRATLYRNGKAVFTAPVGVGTASWPTPAGEFLVRSELTRYASPFYGPVAFGTSARSAVLTDWPAGGFVGIHGTSEPQLLPGRVSHGCIRMRNPDILRLAELMPVGTPLTIR